MLVAYRKYCRSYRKVRVRSSRSPFVNASASELSGETNRDSSSVGLSESN
jgi:hypothetical protein